ncbi:HAD-IIA family hydrolase [Endozoicomonas sp. SCSIO W0465]|uniref:HAD-IIA family hydrolase n=1 Tax=Endozoicomonas sp. SCSIO W0465 TaxID=2918516 RepID=UPI0020755981|nr:HAD-IIA family hydrolase [Endozoicomonas sp. SCSIO W0465]USE38436.1 HAD-IIA family hydrolase [Endozoicomonas sp. SCSIO W0465]
MTFIFSIRQSSMIVLSPDSMNEMYARHLDWYPAIANPPSAPEFIDGLADIMGQFDLVLLDSYGVLCRGSTPIDGAAEAIQQLRANRIPFCVVSNDTLTNRSVAAERYQSRGFDFTGDEVLTSLDITEQYLGGLTNRNHIAVIAPLEHPSNHLLEGMVRLNGCNGEIPKGIDTLLFLTGAGWTAKMQENLVSTANGRQFELVVGNPDIGAPHGEHVTATPGYFVADLVEQTNQKAKPTLFGKPDRIIFSMAMEQHQMTEPSRVLMVGDTLYTDILGGNAMGFKTLLLQCGVYRHKDIMDVISSTGISPHYIAPCL